LVIKDESFLLKVHFTKDYFVISAIYLKAFDR